jgi:hypothetical protein
LGRGIGLVAYYGLTGMDYGAGVSSSGRIVTSATVDTTALHALLRGKPKLSPSLEDELSSLGDSLRMACSDGDSLWVMPLTTALESPPQASGSSCQVVDDELEVFEVDVLIWSELDAKPTDFAGGDGEFTWMMEPLERLEEKHAANPPSRGHQLLVFFASARNRALNIACSSSEMVL